MSSTRSAAAPLTATRTRTVVADELVTAVPENWTWAGEPLEPGPCVLVDVDGVISNGWHRQHFLQNGKRDWKNFFANAAGDTPIDGSIALTRQFDPAIAVVLLTARPHNLQSVTVDWVREHGHRWDLLIIRHRSDGGLSSPKFKQRSLHELIERGFRPQLAIDDDQRNIDMFRTEGLDALYLHSGYYEA